MKYLSSFCIALFIYCFSSAQSFCDSAFSICDSITIDSAWFIHDEVYGDKIFFEIYTEHASLYAPAFVICPADESVLFSDPSKEFFSIVGPSSAQLLYYFSDFEVADLPVLNGRIINDNSNNTFPHCELPFTMPVTATDAVVNGIKQSITVCPNPASDYIYISNYESENLQISVYSMSGDLLFTKKSTSSKAVPVDGLANGLYFFTVSDDTGKRISTGKFIKE